jgi:predicted glycosyltransferase
MRDRPAVHVWIDIENPPQVQYLLPFVDAFADRGCKVSLTARAYGNTLDLLRLRGAAFTAVGAESRRSRVAKMAVAMNRAVGLRRHLHGRGRPQFLLGSSRAGALAAASMAVPSFVISDYEYADSRLFGLTGATILYPDVIDPAPFLKSGVRRSRLVPFRGLKEDISFAGLDLERIPPYELEGIPDDRIVRVLFRPPAERSHYYSSASRALALRTLGYFATREDAVVIMAPRHPWQKEDLKQFSWRNQPLVLREPVAFVALLKAVDLVVSSGGTMVREAAYLGLPAYTVFKSRIGGVDRHLASLGRMRVIESEEQLSSIELRKAPPLAPLRLNPDLRDELVQTLLQRTAARGEASPVKV